MATEVCCGQCQGRLLVETLGVVVACPHCGTHLSIPAPSPLLPPDPGPASSPLPQAPAEPVSPPPTSNLENPLPPVQNPPAPIQSVNESFSTSASETVPGVQSDVAEDPHAASVHGGQDDQFIPSQLGWHSAPNLFLAPGSSPTTAVDTVVAQQQIFSSPVTERPVIEPATWDPVPAAEAAVSVPTNSAFDVAQPPAPSGDAVNSSVSATTDTAIPAVAAFAAAPAAAVTPAAPIFGAAPVSPPPPVTFGAAPQITMAATPLSFGPAPAVPNTTPVFGAAPLSFGAAPQAPASIPSFTVAGTAALPTSTIATSPVPEKSVAEEAAAFAESELLSRQKFLTMLLIIVGSYASAVSIVLAYLLIRGQSSRLESLPDLEPPRGKNGEISWTYNPPKNEVASGHVLKLGQSRRFGNVRVTPLKVTRGHVKFEHYSGRAEMTIEPKKILKLWVKFENVSSNQIFSPVDSYTLFTRRSINLGEFIQANGFVAREADRRQGKSLFYIYELSTTSEFKMAGQNLGQQLEPGENLETFIPSEEAARDLQGDLVWRFQFRKGYNPKSKRGVTTLIDVRFNSKDITEERDA